MGVVENVIEINLVKLLEATQTGYNWVAVPDPKMSSQRYLLLTAGKLHRYWKPILHVFWIQSA